MITSCLKLSWKSIDNIYKYKRARKRKRLEELTPILGLENHNLHIHDYHVASKDLSIFFYLYRFMDEHNMEKLKVHDETTTKRQALQMLMVVTSKNGNYRLNNHQQSHSATV